MGIRHVELPPDLPARDLRAVRLGWRECEDVLEKGMAKSMTVTYPFLGYATTAFLSAVMVFMANMRFPSLGKMSFGSTSLAILPDATTLMIISDTSMLVVVLTEFVVGLLIAKIIGMSIYATYHSAIALVICFVSFTFIR